MSGEGWGDRADFSGASDERVAEGLYEIHRRTRMAEDEHNYATPLTRFDRDWLHEAARRLERIEHVREVFARWQDSTPPELSDALDRLLEDA